MTKTTETAVPVATIDPFDDKIVKVMDALKAPLNVNDVYFRALRYTRDGSKALAFAYMDARAVMNRLDEVFGMNWCLDTAVADCEIDNYIACSAEIRVKLPDGSWVTRSGYGSSDILRGDNGAVTNDCVKSAESDAIKRAAVALGIGRYLYDLPQIWVEWDSQYKKFAKDPKSYYFNADGSMKDFDSQTTAPETETSSATGGSSTRASSSRRPAPSTRGGSESSGGQTDTPSELIEDIKTNYADMAVDLIGDDFPSTCQKIVDNLSPDASKPSAAQIKYIVGLTIKARAAFPVWENVDKREANRLIKDLQGS